MTHALRELYLEELRLAIVEEKKEEKAADNEPEAENDSTSAGSLDAQVQNLLTDYESDASDSGKLNLETFASSVARLAKNFSELIETSHAVVAAAVQFLKSSHDDDTASQFERLMRDEHSISADKTKSEVRDEDSPAPVADRAGPNVG